MGADAVFDDSFAFKDAVISLPDIALNLMVGFCSVSGASDRLPELHIITVCNDMLSALKHYRKYQGLSTYPTAGEQTPLGPKLKGTGPVTSARQIRRRVQDCFDTAYQQMKSDGLVEDAAELRSATIHWLRHTGISEDVKFRPKEHVRDDAGHASMATTDRYIDSYPLEQFQQVQCIQME